MKNYYGGLVLGIDKLLTLEHSDSTARKLNHFMSCFPQFIDEVASGKEWTKEQKLDLPYGKYLATRVNRIHRKNGNLDRKGRRHVLKLMNDGINLYHDIKSYGLKSPVDMYFKSDNRLVLVRGRRRLVILKKLGYETVPVRKFKNREIFAKYQSSPKWNPGESGNTIHDLAGLQFAKLQEKTTDKYWVHCYTPLYDRHIGYLRQNKKLKILELGVKEGASLLLWRDAFPYAKVYGVDKDTDSWHNLLSGQDRIDVLIGNQKDNHFMQMVASKGPYDIVIDDGSHRCEDQQKMFNTLWPVTKSVYVIEDIRGGSYLRKWKRPKGVPTTSEYLKKLVDNTMRHAEINGISFYYNICFIEKL